MPGPDGFIELGTDGSFRRNPITSQGRVVYNAFKDNAQISQRREVEKDGSALYGGSTEDESLSIYPGDLCFTTDGSTAMGMPKKSSYQTFVMSTLNQAFENGQSLDEVRESIRFAGVAGASGARLDCVHPEDDLSIVIGGLQTLLNTGNERINNGDYVLWDVPVPAPNGAPPKHGRNNLNRYLLVTRPYKPDHDENFRKEVGRMVATASGANEPMTGVRGAALELRKLLFASVITAFDSLLRLGFMSEDDISNMLRRPTATMGINSANYPDKAGRLLAFISESLGISEMMERGTPPEPTFASLYLDSLTGEDGGKLDRGSGSDKTVERLERERANFMSQLFLVVNSVSDDVRSRIIGRALTPADPNGGFDCIMGHYSS